MQHMLRTGVAQPKLTVNKPGDEFEREADQVADRVMRMPVTSAGTPPRIQRMCSKCEEELHRKESASAQPSPTGIQLPRGPGLPLPESVRSFFEPRFGHDFGHVRIHTGSPADESAQSLNALAYTAGSDIVFAKGHYSPDTAHGRKLLAHELTHVIQQGSKRGGDTIQRACKDGVLPTGGCVPDPSITPPSTRFLFNVNCDDFAPGQEAAMDAFARGIPPTATIRIVGLASFDGPAGLNERLSCSRAQRGQAVIRRSAPSGVTISSVDATIGGPSTANDPTMRGVGINVSTPVPPPQPVPASPLCPAVPTATPKTCADRHTAYCAAQTCFPANSWLPCVCTASGQVCDAADAFSFTGATGTALKACAAAPPTAPSGPILSKGAWFLSTNSCIWGHWRNALDAIHDPTLAIPSGVTPEWSAAITTCRTSGIGSKNCCEAHVVAEQSAIDLCASYNSATFGLLPTDVPGAPLCSRIVAAAAPPPAFTGDFGKVADRIKYGKSRCCP